MKPRAPAEPFAADAAPDPLDGLADMLDRSAGAALAQVTRGLSPASLSRAFADWWTHLAISPGKQAQLAAKAARKAIRLTDHALNSALTPGPAEPCIRPLPQDHRFDDPAWRQQPFELIQQGFLLWQQWWDAATCCVGGTTAHDEARPPSARTMIIRCWPRRRGPMSTSAEAGHGFSGRQAPS